jgi:hypothetical protein
MRRLLTVSTVALVGCASPLPPVCHPPGPLVLGPPTKQVVVIVRIRAPWYALAFIIRRRFRQAAPQYQALAGLRRKYFTLTDDRLFGGIYLWEDRASADVFFTDVWHANIRRKYGVPGALDVFDAPFVVEGTCGASSDAVAALLFVAPHALERLMAGLHPAPGLVRTYLLRRGDDRAAAVTLWTNRAAAEAFLTVAWRASAHVEGLTWFAAPVLIEGPPQQR